MFFVLLFKLAYNVKKKYLETPNLNDEFTEKLELNSLEESVVPRN